MKSTELISNEEYLVIVGIVVSPFLFFLYNLYPQVNYWPLYINGLHKIKFLNDLNFELWYYAYRFLALGLTSIWFLTCSRSWRYLILILAYAQLWHISAGSDAIFRENKIMITAWINNYLIPFLIFTFYTIVIIYLKKVLGFKSSSNKGLYRTINKEIYASLNSISKVEIREIKEKRRTYNKLRKDKDRMSEDDYLKELIRLRDS